MNVYTKNTRKSTSLLNELPAPNDFLKSLLADIHQVPFFRPGIFPAGGERINWRATRLADYSGQMSFRRGGENVTTVLPEVPLRPVVKRFI
jgi:hypothetical protein